WSIGRGHPGGGPTSTDSTGTSVKHPQAREYLRMVRLRGLEPQRGRPHSALNAARLPVPPQPHPLWWQVDLRPAFSVGKSDLGRLSNVIDPSTQEACWT